MNRLRNILLGKINDFYRFDSSTMSLFCFRELQTLGFSVEQDSFVDRAPIVGDLQFTNIIGRLNENADRYLALACHYDSKYFANSSSFVAAIDSAVPCAQMLYAAKMLQPLLNRSRTDVSLMVSVIT